MGSEILGKKRQFFFFFLLPFASLSPRDFTTEFTDQKIFSRNTDKLTGICRDFQKSQHLLKEL